MMVLAQTPLWELRNAPGRWSAEIPRHSGNTQLLLCFH